MSAHVEGGSVRVVRSRVGDGGAAVLRAVCAGVWREGAAVMKEGERAWVLGGEAEVDGERVGVVVKWMVLDRAKDRVSRAVGRTRLLRQWRGALLLEGAGVDVARVLVVGRGRDGEGRVVEVLVMERVDGRTLIGHVGGEELSGGERRELARRVGAQVAAMALSAPGVFNRDHKGSNIVVARGEGGVRPVMIDTAGVRRWRVGDVPIAMLAKVYIEMVGVGRVASRVERWRALRAFYEVYLEDWGAAGVRTRRAQVKKGWGAIERMVARHGDATPRDPVKG